MGAGLQCRPVHRGLGADLEKVLRQPAPAALDGAGAVRVVEVDCHDAEALGVALGPLSGWGVGSGVGVGQGGCGQQFRKRWGWDVIALVRMDHHDAEALGVAVGPLQGWGLGWGWGRGGVEQGSAQMQTL